MTMNEDIKKYPCFVLYNIIDYLNTDFPFPPQPKERILNPDIAEFFYATNERFK